MERLTSKWPSGVVAVPQGMMPEALEKLYAYEDTGLEPEEIVKMGMMFEDSKRYSGRLEAKLKRYQEAESEGRLVILPCKVGDTVYELAHGYVERETVSGFGVDIHTNVYSFRPVDIGKTAFLTREEAEEAMKRGDS